MRDMRARVARFDKENPITPDLAPSLARWFALRALMYAAAATHTERATHRSEMDGIEAEWRLRVATLETASIRIPTATPDNGWYVSVPNA